uniref:SAP domain-containing protein n=1 Tax=Chlamydomonas leiostraca TaxID=1034604 RepID=A0A7S0S1Z3_9CHLO|eukprot:CAMPEP_0202857264 /NCGR_PEP_ID=MMETSP1391-20130828/274_1 /ASSEMBLY_ACC=CAM_ASM_000867 /TAXON_ID=1034604 /ORGANISM="Chlamydomonas leiostraca, Strain SAG 11-49" /LENGTH=404 /DNA_ID=CAMNT_0049536047 /DNA_START=80 /DNA_END=1294 /DNA_ORIENTATION=-
MEGRRAHDILAGLTLPMLRQQCRARGLSPAGAQDVLRSRLTECMVATQDFSILAVDQAAAEDVAGSGVSKNNYQRPAGNQNLGNRISDRPSSRVLAPPGGGSTFVFGDGSAPETYKTPGRTGAGNPGAMRNAEALLDRMGLGDTDDLVAGHGATPVQVNKHHVQEVSQLAFGDYRLPSTATVEGPNAQVKKSQADEMQDAMVMHVDGLIRPLMLKDLRVQCRARGLSPAGGVEQLRQTLGSHMIQTGDLSMYADGQSAPAYGAGPQPAPPAAAYGGAPAPGGGYQGNNYARPGGQQNVGNFISDRPSSRVLAPPGGGSAGVSGALFGGPEAAPLAANHHMPPNAQYAAPQLTTAPWLPSPAKGDAQTNNYSRPGNCQNVGNFITDRPSSRVLAPPGGKSQITFG